MEINDNSSFTNFIWLMLNFQLGFFVNSPVNQITLRPI